MSVEVTVTLLWNKPQWKIFEHVQVGTITAVYNNERRLDKSQNTLGWVWNYMTKRKAELICKGAVVICQECNHYSPREIEL